MAGYLEDLVQNIYTNCDMSGLDKLNQGLQDAIWYSGELERNLRDAQKAQKMGFDFHTRAINQSKEAYKIESLRQRLDYEQQNFRARLAEQQQKWDETRQQRQDRYNKSLNQQNVLFKYARRLFLAAFSIGTLKNIIDMGAKLQLTQKSIEGLTKSTQDWKYVEGIALKFGVSLDTIAKGYKNFYSAASMAGFGKESIQTMYADLLLSARAIGATEEQTGGALLALEQMISKGIVSMEELRRQLGNALPGAFEVGAKAMNMTTKEFNEFVKKGELASTEFVPKFIEAYKEAYSSGWKDVEQTFNVAQGRLKVAWQMFTLEFMSGEAGKAFVEGLDALRATISSPMFHKFVAILGKILALVAKILKLCLEQLPLILTLLGAMGLNKILVQLVSTIMSIQLAFFQATGSVLTFGQAGVMAIGSITSAVGVLMMRLTAILGILFIVQDLIYFIGERFWGWNTKSALGARIAQHNRMKNIEETSVLPDKDRLLSMYKKGSPNYNRMKKAIETGDVKTINEMRNRPDTLIPTDKWGRDISLEKTQDIKNDVKIDIKIDGGNKDPNIIGNFVYTKIVNELAGLGIALNPEETIAGKE